MDPYSPDAPLQVVQLTVNIAPNIKAAAFCVLAAVAIALVLALIGAFSRKPPSPWSKK